MKKRCWRWLDGEHCYEVSLNRGSKRCACEAEVLLVSPASALPTKCGKCGLFSNWTFAGGICPHGSHKKKAVRK